MSPSMRREWIEIYCPGEWDDYAYGLPPCGGSGLKYGGVTNECVTVDVSLHAEGVD